MQQSLANLESMFTDLKGDVVSTSQESKTNIHLVEQARRMSMAKAQQTALLGQDQELDAMLQELDEAEDEDVATPLKLEVAVAEEDAEPEPMSFFTGALVATAATKWAHLSPSRLDISASPREEEDDERESPSPSPPMSPEAGDGLSAWEQEAELAAELAAEEDELRRLEHAEEVAREQAARQAKKKKQEQKRRKQAHAAAARAEAEKAAARNAEAAAAREIEEAAEAKRKDAERRRNLQKDKQRRQRREKEQRAAAAAAAALREQEEQNALAELEVAEAKRREEQKRRESARKAELKQRQRAKAQREAAKVAAAEADAKRREEQERYAAVAAATDGPGRTGSGGLTRAAEAALAARLSAQKPVPSEDTSPKSCSGSPSQRRAQREHAARLATRSCPEVVEEAEPPRGAATAGFWDAFVARNDKLIEDRDEKHRERMLSVCLARQSHVSEEEIAEFKKLIELNPKEFAEFLATNAKFEREWKKSLGTGNHHDTADTASSHGWNSDGISPVAARNVYRHAPVGLSHHGTRTLSQVGMRVFKVVAPKIAVRSHYTLDSPKVGSLAQGDTIIVTDRRRIRVTVDGAVSSDDDEALSVTGTSLIERLHCLSGWVSATSTETGVALVEEDRDATARTQLVSGVQQLESRMRPIKKRKASINHFVARQERAAEIAAAQIAAKRAAAESEELAEVKAPNGRVYRKAADVSESVLKPTKSFEAMMQEREARQQQQAIEAAREQALLSPSSSPSKSPGRSAPVNSPMPSTIAVATSARHELEDSAA
eukprot:COSAG02_NODE_545_length_20533_cov_5.447663_9_plen_777_part_00